MGIIRGSRSQSSSLREVFTDTERGAGCRDGFHGKSYSKLKKMYADALNMQYDWRPITVAVRSWIRARGCGCVELPVATVDDEFGTAHFTARANTLVINVRWAEDAKFFLLLKPALMRADMRSVRRALGGRSARAATSGEVHRITRCRPGCVPPIGSLFELPLLIDARLVRSAAIFVPSGQPGFATLVRMHDLIKNETAMVIEDSSSNA